MPCTKPRRPALSSTLPKSTPHEFDDPPPQFIVVTKSRPFNEGNLAIKREFDKALAVEKYDIVYATRSGGLTWSQRQIEFVNATIIRLKRNDKISFSFTRQKTSLILGLSYPSYLD